MPSCRQSLKENGRKGQNLIKRFHEIKLRNTLQPTLYGLNIFINKRKFNKYSWDLDAVDGRMLFDRGDSLNLFGLPDLKMINPFYDQNGKSNSEIGNFGLILFIFNPHYSYILIFIN